MPLKPEVDDNSKFLLTLDSMEGEMFRDSCSLIVRESYSLLVTKHSFELFSEKGQ